MRSTVGQLEAERQLVWGENRVFVTPVVGCPAACEFCYLQETGESAPRYATVNIAARLWEGIRGNSRFVSGREGTLVSLGCLSETLAPHSIAATLDFVDLLTGIANPVQLATRWVVANDNFARFVKTVKAAGVVLFHSVTTITSQRRFESGTPSWELREGFIQRCLSEGIASVLYIKPFLPGITASDTAAFCDLIHRLNLRNVVVGPLYAGTGVAERLTPLLPRHWESDCCRLEAPPVPGKPGGEPTVGGSEYRAFVACLARTGANVAPHSTDIIRSLRG